MSIINKTSNQMQKGNYLYLHKAFNKSKKLLNVAVYVFKGTRIAEFNGNQIYSHF